jgi:hypothetical protein
VQQKQGTKTSIGGNQEGSAVTTGLQRAMNAFIHCYQCKDDELKVNGRAFGASNNSEGAQLLQGGKDVAVVPVGVSGLVVDDQLVPKRGWPGPAGAAA